jgi:hypothetical protein
MLDATFGKGDVVCMQKLTAADADWDALKAHARRTCETQVFSIAII